MAADASRLPQPDRSPRSVEEHATHLAEMLEAPLRNLGTETLSLDEALGRATADAPLTPVDLPLFRNSQMDGFAVRSVDLGALPARLRVVGEIAAGPWSSERQPLLASAAPSAPTPVSGLGPGETFRIMTGAAIPEGADAVVPVEDTSPATAEGESSAEEWVLVHTARIPGSYVREPGSDLRAGQQLLPEGLRLESRHLGALAAAGIDTVRVRARLRLAVITTGSEIVPPGTEPQHGQTFDSNGVALAAAIRSAGARLSLHRHVTDDPAAMRAALAEASAASDVIITSGGISMGRYEVVREVLEPLGARVGTVAMQPGGPQASGFFDGVPVICFPGNPVSTQLSFEVFLAPLLRAAAGLPAPARSARRLAHPLRSSVPGKRQFLRGRLLADGRVEQVAGPGSHLVAALAAADLLIVVPEEITSVKADDEVETWTL